jgi:hypothetical protein
MVRRRWKESGGEEKVAEGRKRRRRRIRRRSEIGEGKMKGRDG